jgi:hypothetical protein
MIPDFYDVLVSGSGEIKVVDRSIGEDWILVKHFSSDLVSVEHAAAFTDPITPAATEIPPPAPEVSRVRRADAWMRAVPWLVLGVGFLLGVAVSWLVFR